LSEVKDINNTWHFNHPMEELQSFHYQYIAHMKRGFFYLCLLFLLACEAGYEARIENTSTRIAMDTSVAVDEGVEALIAPYKKELDAQMDRIIGEAAEEFNNDAGPTGESTLGDFVADLLLVQSRKEYGEDVDLAVINHRGGLRTSIRKGPVSVRNIFELMPFENEIWILELSGEQTQMLFDNAARRKSNVIGGATFTIIDDERAEDIVINGLPFDPSNSYKVSISDYLAGGGGGHGFLSELAPFQDNDYLCRDMILEHIEEVSGATGEPIVPLIDQRVVIK